MGYRVKIQRVERGATKSFYVNFPAAVAEGHGKRFFCEIFRTDF